MKRTLKVDDSLDVFTVHGVGGMLGTLLAGILSSPDLGIFSGYGFGKDIQSIGAQLNVQLLGVLATVIYTAVLTWGILKIVQMLIGLRVTQEEEMQGLDITQHEERGYDYL
jgi:Amt family ammonium transporter